MHQMDTYMPDLEGIKHKGKNVICNDMNDVAGIPGKSFRNSLENNTLN